MTIPWQSPANREFYYDLASDDSPLTSRGRDAVPIGTVAARIMELQNLAMSSKSDGSRSPVTWRREKGRSGFGRRIEPRFGQPASRSSKPDEEIHIEPKHSFLGLNTQRGNHTEDHALVVGRAKWDRTAGFLGQLQPSRLGARVNYEATNPWRVMPNGKSRRNSHRNYNSQEMETLVNSSNKTQVSSMAPLTSRLTPHHGEGDLSITEGKSTSLNTPKSRRRTATDQRKFSCEGLSFETTSTMRRRSVKDLYYHYGIQRPAGLSSESGAFNPELTPRPLVKYRYCHVCSLASSLVALKCECGHSACGDCEDLSSYPITTSDTSAECTELVLKCEDKPLQKGKAKDQPSDCEVPKQAHLKQQTVRPMPTQQSSQVELNQRQKSKMHRSCSKEQLDSIPIMFPILHLEDATPANGSCGMLSRYAEPPDSSGTIQQTTITSETVTSVRESPFLVAGTLSSTHSAVIVPIGVQVAQVESQNLQYGRYHQLKRCYHRGSHSSLSPNFERGSGSDSCDSSGCRATHQGYRPYRHSITCTRKRCRYPEETDSGYIAGASYLEELEIPARKAESESRHENQVYDHDRTDKPHLSSWQTENCSLQGKTNTHRDNHPAHQESHEQSVNMVPAPKPHIEMKSPGRLTDDTTIPSLITNKQDTSTMGNNKVEPDVHTILTGKSEHENPSNIASQLSLDVHKSKSKHSEAICTSANSQDFRKTMAAVPSIASEEKHPEHRAQLNAGLTTDTSPSVSVQQSGDISPRKFQPASRRLSAFFKLQEQNIVSLLNKRLQQHQDELKRLDREFDDKNKVAAHNMSLNQEQDRQENKEGELEEGDSEKIFGNNLSSSPLQLRERGRETKALGTDWHEGIDDTSPALARRDRKIEPLDAHHDCAWKRMDSEKQEDLPGTQISAKVGKEEASEIAIKGITIVIHLEGREDVVIKADLSQGV